MRLTVYNLKFNSDRIGTLVKESAINYGDTQITTQEKAVQIIETLFDASNLTEEHVWMVALDGARKTKAVFDISHGTLMSSLVHPREIFTRAILAGAASIILAHNHPSGMLDISEQDREVSKRIMLAGHLLGIELDDHIIIAENRFASAM